MNLQQLIANAKQSGTNIVKSEVPFAEVASIPNQQKLAALEMPVGNFHGQGGVPDFYYREEIVASRNVSIPFVVTSIRYEINSYKSLLEESLGDDTGAANVTLLGYDILTDAQGKPRIEKHNNPAFKKGSDEPEFLETYVLRNKDENGNPIEPQEMLYMRLQYSIDPRSKAPKLRIDAPQNSGVVHKRDKETRQITGIDWTAMPNLENKILAPILNKDELDEAAQGFFNEIFIPNIGKSRAVAELSQQSASGGQYKPASRTLKAPNKEEFKSGAVLEE